MRLGTFIKGNFESAYGEGAFQYVALLALGLTATDARICVVVSSASRPAFIAWADQFPAAARARLEIVATPPEVATLSRKVVEELERSVDCWFFLRPDIPDLSLFHKPRCAIFADLVTEE